MENKKQDHFHHRAHPWHGVSIGERAPEYITAYIELVPSDTVKYELDKDSGVLKIDRPQLYSNVCPAMYGLVPRTYSGTHTAQYCMEKSGRKNIVGDGDPLDILVLTEKNITHGDILVTGKVIGGLRMIDNGEIDDKIIAVLQNDALYATWNDIYDLPKSITDRLRHYFLTYKNVPGNETHSCEILKVYGKQEAFEVIDASIKDYEELFHQ